MSMNRLLLTRVSFLLAFGLVACGAPIRPQARSSQVQIRPEGVSPGPARVTAPASPSPAGGSPLPDNTALPPVSAAAISAGNPDRPEVALVFNVGAGSPPALDVLETLHAASVPATFMVMGWLARDHADVVRSIVAGGFEVGSHGYAVPDLTQVSDAAVASDLASADAVLTPLVGHSTRPLWSPSAGAQDARVRRVAASIGYDTLLWTVDSGDWRTDASAAGVESAVIPRLTNGTIVVLHFDSPRSRVATAAALPPILQAIRARGLTPVTLTTLLAHLRSPAPAGG